MLRANHSAESDISRQEIEALTAQVDRFTRELLTAHKAIEERDELWHRDSEQLESVGRETAFKLQDLENQRVFLKQENEKVVHDSEEQLALKSQYFDQEREQLECEHSAHCEAVEMHHNAEVDSIRRAHQAEVESSRRAHQAELEQQVGYA